MAVNPIYELNEYDNFIKARNGAKATTVTIDGSVYLVVVGGFESGTGDGFVQIQSTHYPNNFKLNNKQSSQVKFNLLDEAGDEIESRMQIDFKSYVQSPMVQSELLSLVRRDLFQYQVILDNDNAIA